MLCLGTSLRAYRAACVIIAVSSSFALARPSFFLADKNSAITVNTNLEAAISSWQVDGVQQLHEMSNWYRIGSSGPETSAHTIPLSSAVASDTNFDGFDDRVDIVYSHPQFDLALTYIVTGFAPGSGHSKMGESVRITNTSAAPLAFHFFEYNDFNLTNTPNDDTVVQSTATGGFQSDGTTTVSCNIFDVDEYELAAVPVTLNKLTNGTATTLSYPPGLGAPFGPNDVTWSLQWDFIGVNPNRPIILPGQTATITKDWDLQTIPEPNSAIVVAVVIGSSLLRRPSLGGRRVSR